jgi:PST family polysaccharide transporter
MAKGRSYGQVLTSSSIMGGAAGLSLLLAMLRTKVAAVLVGTIGVGLVSSLGAVQGVVTTLAGLGIHSSAVRDLAAAFGRNDALEISRIVISLRRLCWATGLAGAAIIALASPFISQLTFGSQAYALDIASLGIVILLTNISGGQSAVIQGSRRIADLGRMQIASAAAGTVCTIGFYFWLGLRGIVPALIATAAINLAVSWYFARRVPVLAHALSWRDSGLVVRGMVRLGLAMMWTSLLAAALAYATTSLINVQLGLRAVGIYSAAFALSGVFLNFVLEAMGSDYFPRLAAATDDPATMNRLANEQTEVGLLLAVPGLVATLALAPLAIHVFYSAVFVEAVPLLQWFVLGCLGRVISWPLGFMLLALGRGRRFLFTETSAIALHFALVLAGIHLFGLEGVAIAFCVSYVAYICIVHEVMRRMTGFGWTAGTRKIMLLLAALCLATFLAVRVLPTLAGTLVGLALTVAAGLISLRGLLDRVGVEHGLMRKVLKVPGVRFLCGL